MDDVTRPARRSVSHGALSSAYADQSRPHIDPVPSLPSFSRLPCDRAKETEFLCGTGSLAGMLKQSTETGDIGVFSIRPKKSMSTIERDPPRSQPSLPNMRAAHRSQSRSSETSAAFKDRQPLPSHRDSTSEIISMYGSDDHRSVRTPFAPVVDETAGRSFSMTSYGSGTPPLYRPNPDLPANVNSNGLQPSRSRYQYPTRLKRLGVRPSSPALTEDGSVDYSRMVESDHVSSRTVHNSHRPAYMQPALRRQLPLTPRVGVNQSRPPIFYDSRYPRPVRVESQASMDKQNSSSTQTANGLICLDVSAQGHASAAENHDSGAAAKSAELSSRKPMYYDYSEAWEDAEETKQTQIVPVPMPPRVPPRPAVVNFSHLRRPTTSSNGYTMQPGSRGEKHYLTTGLLPGSLPGQPSREHLSQRSNENLMPRQTGKMTGQGHQGQIHPDEFPVTSMPQYPEPTWSPDSVPRDGAGRSPSGWPIRRDSLPPDAERTVGRASYAGPPAPDTHVGNFEASYIASGAVASTVGNPTVSSQEHPVMLPNSNEENQAHYQAPDLGSRDDRTARADREERGGVAEPLPLTGYSQIALAHTTNSHCLKAVDRVPQTSKLGLLDPAEQNTASVNNDDRFDKSTSTETIGDHEAMRTAKYAVRPANSFEDYHIAPLDAIIASGHGPATGNIGEFPHHDVGYAPSQTPPLSEHQDLAMLKVNTGTISEKGGPPYDTPARTETPMLAPKPMSPARQLRVKNSIPNFYKALPPVPLPPLTPASPVRAAVPANFNDFDLSGLTEAHSTLIDGVEPDENEHGDDMTRDHHPTVSRVKSLDRRLKLRSTPSTQRSASTRFHGVVQHNPITGRKRRGHALTRKDSSSGQGDPRPKLRLKVSRGALSTMSFEDTGTVQRHNHVPRSQTISDLAAEHPKDLFTPLPKPQMLPKATSNGDGRGKYTIEYGSSKDDFALNIASTPKSPVSQLNDKKRGSSFDTRLEQPSLPSGPNTTGLQSFFSQGSDLVPPRGLRKRLSDLRARLADTRPRRPRSPVVRDQQKMRDMFCPPTPTAGTGGDCAIRSEKAASETPPEEEGKTLKNTITRWMRGAKLAMRSCVTKRKRVR